MTLWPLVPTLWTCALLVLLIREHDAPDANSLERVSVYIGVWTIGLVLIFATRYLP